MHNLHGSEVSAHLNKKGWQPFRASFWMILSSPLSRKSFLFGLFSRQHGKQKQSQTDSVLRMIPSTDGYFSEKNNPVRGGFFSEFLTPDLWHLPASLKQCYFPTSATALNPPFRNHFNSDSAAFLTSLLGSWGDGVSHICAPSQFLQWNKPFTWVGCPNPIYCASVTGLTTALEKNYRGPHCQFGDLG